MIIYKATNLINNKVYFSVSSRNINDAISMQVSAAKKKRKKMKLKDTLKGKSPFHKAIIRYGKHNFHFELLHSRISSKRAYNYKKKYIKEYNAMNPIYGYNCTTGGKETFKQSKEAIERMSESQTGKTMPESFVELMKGRVGELHPCYGYKHTDEARENMKQGQLNSDYIQSEEIKKQKSDTMKKRWKEPEVIEKMANRVRPPVTDETRKKLSNALSGKNNPMYGRTGELSPHYGKDIPQWHRDAISEKNKKHSEARKKIKLQKYSNMTEKRCNHCKETKELNLFPRCKKNLSGYLGHCKDCDRIRNKERYYRLHSPNKKINRYGELIKNIIKKGEEWKRNTQ